MDEEKYYGYIYKVTIPTEYGLKYYWGKHKYSDYPNKDPKYWSSSSFLKDWLKKKLNKNTVKMPKINEQIAQKFNLTLEIVAWYKSKKELADAEKAIIEIHFGKEYCVNYSLNNENYDATRSEEFKQRLSEQRKGIPKPECKIWLHDAIIKRNKIYKVTGRKRWTNGQEEKLCFECPGEGWTRGRAKLKFKKRWFKNNNGEEIYADSCPPGFVPGKYNKAIKRVKVYCVELNIIFNSMREAQLYFNKTTNHIREVCLKKSRRKTWNNYHWEFVD